MADTTDVSHQEPRATRLQRRYTLRRVTLPVLGGGIFILAVLLITMFLPSRSQVSLIADLSLTILVLCPLALCLFPVFLLLLIMIVSTNRVHKGLLRALVRVEGLSRSMTEKSAGAAETINRQTVTFGNRVAPLGKWVNAFEESSQTQEVDNGTDNA